MLGFRMIVIQNDNKGSEIAKGKKSINCLLFYHVKAFIFYLTTVKHKKSRLMTVMKRNQI